MKTIEGLTIMGSHIFREGKKIYEKNNFYELREVYLLLKDGVLIGDYISEKSYDGAVHGLCIT